MGPSFFLRAHLVTALRLVTVAWLPGVVACSSSSTATTHDAAVQDAAQSSEDAQHDGARAADASHPSADARLDHDDSGAILDAGSPITAPDDTWTWVDFPASKCASGTPTGIAINPHAGATELLIYFEGGGSCYSAETCWGASPSADNLAGYDATTFATAKQVAYPTLVRSTSGNPFAAMNMVFVPYCTGDLHVGSTMTTYAVDGGSQPTYFWGAKDLSLFLSRVAPTFPKMSRVISLGTSAGGYGSFLDYGQLVQAFAGVRVDIVDDSGPPLTRVGQTDNATLLSRWGADLPASCTGCDSFLDVMKWDRSTQPASKLAFLSLAEDTVISVDYGYTLESYGPAVESLFSTTFGGDPNVATYFVGDFPGHVVEAQPSLEPDYVPWLSALVTGSSSWTSTTVDGGEPDGG